ncbi:hypothetical protein [Neoaquamicrobium sediminum]|uniref:ASCH domain containing protein n=2 Tax=root TaxID=1 RepID=A0AB38ZLM4_9VIRU
MSDKPILFSAPMVRAILREIEQPGTGKTQTRRLINFEGIESVVEFVPVATDNKSGRRVYEMKDAAGQFFARPAGKHLVEYHFMPRHAAGDRLYVQEAWRTSGSLNSSRPRDLPTSSAILFEADGAPAPVWRGKKRPGMFMPRWASRITLIVTDVRVQRLQEISEADAIAEGAEVSRVPGLDGGPMVATENPHIYATPYRWFRELWDTLNAARGYGWDANPWVAAYTFRPILGNIDQVQP